MKIGKKIDGSMNNEKIEIDFETFKGVYLILCGVPYDHRGAEVYENAIPIMNKAHKKFIEIGKNLGLDNRGRDI